MYLSILFLIKFNTLALTHCLLDLRIFKRLALIWRESSGIVLIDLPIFNHYRAETGTQEVYVRALLLNTAVLDLIDLPIFNHYRAETGTHEVYVRALLLDTAVLDVIDLPIFNHYRAETGTHKSDVHPSQPRCSSTLGEIMASVSQVASGSSETQQNISQVNDSLYLFYKPPVDTPNIQILFFHGLQRGRDYSEAHVSTWKNGDGSCIWPQTWLVEDFPRAHVFSVFYRWGSAGTDMYIIAENLLSDLLEANIGLSCPVVLVGHSIGGLVIKQLCEHAHGKLSTTRELEKARLSAFLNSIKGVFFYSTPHHGSAIARKLKRHFGSHLFEYFETLTIARKLKRHSRSHLLEYFETLSTPAARLNYIFDQISKEHYKWLFAGLGETLPTDMGPFKEVVVEEASARGNVGNFYSVPGADHFSICRPENKVLASFGKLKTFICDILNDLKDDDDVARTIERLPLPWIQDPKYVELKKTLKKVKEALESETAGRVITLSGASGDGKTSMARHLALWYQNADRRSPDGVRAEELRTQNSASRWFRDGVIFLTCSSNEVIISPLLELWKKLGYELLPLIEAIPGDASSSSGMQESCITESRLLNELTRKMEAQNILIILDDVHDSMLIQKFLRIHGEALKFLITTQNPEIWGDRTCKRIPIGTPTSEEACHILRNHVYGRHTDITQPIQDAIDAIVEKAACHPLVLANVAANIQGESDYESEEWENARRNFDELVEDDATNTTAVLYDEMYPRSVKASIKMTLSTLSKEVETKSLLLLASIFESQSTPEVVFKLFAKKRHGRLAKFPRWSKRLQDTNFIRVDFTGSERTWFLHPLRQRFIERIEESEVKSMVEGVLERKTEDDDIAVIGLLIVYGQDKWRKQAAEALSIPMPQFQIDSVQSWSLHLAAVKPFVGLIHVDPGKEWEKKSDGLAKQILQKYIYCQELDDESVYILLSATETYTHTLKALSNFSPLNSARLFLPKTISAVINLLEPESSATLATQVLLHFCSDDENKKKFGQLPNAMERLVALLAENVSETTKQSATLALANLAADAENKRKIGQLPNAMERLVALLADNLSEITKYKASGALGNLAADAENRRKIGQLPNAIERLVALLAENVSEITKQSATLALANLAADAENERKIGQLPNAMERLVALLADKVSEVTKQKATRALANLAMDAENCRKIGQLPNAMERLVALLADNVSEATNQRATVALANLALNAQNRIKIGQFGMVFRRLVTFLGKKESKITQSHAGLALRRLSLEGHRGDYEGALEAYEDDQAANDPRLCKPLARRCFVKANRGDYEGALTDINKFIELGGDRQFGLQERGIARRMQGDLYGALADLNDSLSLESDDYECLKHRGLVKFLLLDEDGARADAECALRVKPARVDTNKYGTDLFLRERSVEYLGYNLK